MSEVFLRVYLGLGFLFYLLLTICLMNISISPPPPTSLPPLPPPLPYQPWVVAVVPYPVSTRTKHEDPLNWLEVELNASHDSADNSCEMDSIPQGRSCHTTRSCSRLGLNHINNMSNMTYHDGTANIMDKWCWGPHSRMYSQYKHHSTHVNTVSHHWIFQIHTRGSLDL